MGCRCMPFPVEPRRIEEEEQKLARHLPVPLRDRLSEDNGGEVWAADREWYLFPVWDPTDRGYRLGFCLRLGRVGISDRGHIPYLTD